MPLTTVRHPEAASVGKTEEELKAAGVALDRKVLADIAVRDPGAFKALAEQARAAAGAGRGEPEEATGGGVAVEGRTNTGAALGAAPVSRFAARGSCYSRSGSEV